MEWTDWREMSKFQTKVFDFLDSMPYNSENYIIDNICKAETKAYFIETVIEYMRINFDNYMGYIHFSEDFSMIRKTDKIIKNIKKNTNETK